MAVVVYYVLFEALAPFAILFRSGWPRVLEGVLFAVVAATVHPRLGRRSGVAALAFLGVYFIAASVYIRVAFHASEAGVAVVGVVLLLLAAAVWRRGRSAS